jgi:cephalosporin hydroxylase
MNEPERFRAEVQDNIEKLKGAGEMQQRSKDWLREVGPLRYAYNWSWMGMPIIQLPQDIMAMQELIWRLDPELIVETGVARGGSLVFYASMLALRGSGGTVLGIDIDIRAHNLEAILAHPMASRIDLLQGSSIDPGVVAAVKRRAAGKKRVLVVLDSNHTHDHVRAELLAYEALVPTGGYLVVFDTAIEDQPKEAFPDRDWGPGNSPKSAVAEFLRGREDWVVDLDIDAKLLISVAPGGYLRRVKGP